LVCVAELPRHLAVGIIDEVGGAVRQFLSPVVGVAAVVVLAAVVRVASVAAEAVLVAVVPLGTGKQEYE
jgi:hypothetical protein